MPRPVRLVRARLKKSILAGVIAIGALAPSVTAQQKVRRVTDESGFFDPYNTRRMEDHLQYMHDESRADVRVIFAPEISEPIEGYALKRVRELGMGREDNGRSLLFVYDIRGQRMRLEVGPGLESIFPDGLVGYLMRGQTASLFAAGDRVQALRSTLYLVSYRLREAMLHEGYDPRRVSYLTDSVHLAAGGGASARGAVAGVWAGAIRPGPVPQQVRERFGAQPTVAGVYARYLEAMRDGYLQSNLPLYTSDSEESLRRFQMVRSFADFVVYSEYGQKYTIIERGDLAILFFTTTPLVSTRHFRRSAAGWQLDILADNRNTREYIGGNYTWEMRYSGDEYSKVFADVYVKSQGMLRPALGDNRPLSVK